MTRVGVDIWKSLKETMSFPPPWLVPDGDFWLSFAGKRGLAQMLWRFPFQWPLAQQRAKCCLLH